MKFILLFCLLLPIHLYSLDVRQVNSDVRAYWTQFQSYETGFTMLSKKKNGGRILKGTYTFKNGEGFCQLNNIGLGYAGVNRKDNTLEMKSLQDDLNSILDMLNTIYTVILTNDFTFRTESESTSNVLIRGGNKAETIELLLGYNKNLKIVESFQYIDKESPQKIEAGAEYTNIDGIYVLSLIQASLPDRQATIHLNRTSFELKPVTNE